MKFYILILLILIFNISLFANTYDTIIVKVSNNDYFSSDDYNIVEAKEKKYDKLFSGLDDLVSSLNTKIYNINETTNELDNLYFFYDSEYTLDHSISKDKKNLIFEIKDDDNNILEKAFLSKNVVEIFNNDYAEAFNRVKNVDFNIQDYASNLESNVETTLISKEIVNYRLDKENNNIILIQLLRIYENYDKEKIVNSSYYKNLKLFDIENGKLISYNGISKEINIPEGVTEVAEGFSFNNYFTDMRFLEKVTLPKSLKKIGTMAFAYCDKLKEIDLSNVEYIGQGAFRECSVLEKVKFSNNISKILPETFYGCNLQNIVLPSSIKEIKNGAFYNNRDIKSIEFNNGIERIGDHAFALSNDSTTSSLDKLKFPSSLIYIGKSAFQGYTNFKSIEFNEGLEKIDDQAFGNIDPCYNNVLDTLKFPNSLVYIGESAFKNYHNVGQIYFGDNLQIIEAHAFENMPILNEKLEKINLPISLVNIGYCAFGGYPNLKEINFNKNLKKIDDLAFTNSEKKPNIYLEKLIFPENLEEIGNMAFLNYPNLKEISFNDNLKKIGNVAFGNSGNNNSLEKLIFPKNLEEIGNMAFFNYHKLNEIAFNDNLKKIGSYAFAAGDIKENKEKPEIIPLGKKIEHIKINNNTEFDDTTFLR